jgi:FKBP-type peptidyl-prolyl cis-trans isomerase
MKLKFLSIGIAAVMLASCNNVDVPGTKEVNLEDENEKLGYAIGVQVGSDIKDGVEYVDLNGLLKGMADVFADNAAMDRDEALKVVNEYFIKKQEEEMAGNRAEGEAFLAEIEASGNVTKTESGLMYEVIKEGSGAKPSPTSVVKVHYEGTLKSGDIFDSSKQRGEPTEFGVNQVIKGWTEGLQLMSVGSVYKFYIPSNLAYGERGAGQMIGPNEPLVFEVELIDIVK